WSQARHRWPAGAVRLQAQAAREHHPQRRPARADGHRRALLPVRARLMLELACSSDAGFLPHVSAMLHSALTHTPAPVRVWLMHARELPAESVDKLRAVVEGKSAKLELLPIQRELLQGFPTERFHEAAWYKILLPALLPQLERVLYIDADTI